MIPDDHFGPTYDGRVLSEYTQLFGLADGLTAADASEDLYLFQYRKFVTLRQGSSRSTNLPFAFSASPSEAARIFPTANDLVPGHGRTLVGPRLSVRSLAQEYARAHIATDFVRLCLALSTVVGFSVERCGAFAACPVFVPSPALGLYQVQTFLRHMQILRDAWAVFHARFYQPRDGYQRRVGGFLLERLHSFLVLEEASRGIIPQLVHGHQIIVGNTLEVVLTI
ncbi:MAG: hypothetical protein ABI697_09790 [Devosia sp.]